VNLDIGVESVTEDAVTNDAEAAVNPGDAVDAAAAVVAADNMVGCRNSIADTLDAATMEA
jgi:uncharacterized cupin superfamily protein